MGSSGEVLERLRSALGSKVNFPGTVGYQGALATVFLTEAARRRPVCVVAPRTVEDVATVLRIAAAARVRVTVRGGGLSSGCVADNAVLLDLSRHLNTVRVDGERVIAGGGATMGGLARALAPVNRTVPVGVTGLAGMGMATRGGIGYLTRSLGLTLDHLVEVELVVATGDVVRLSDGSRGEDAELWWAVRGGAPFVGVVTSAVFRTHAVCPVRVDRAVLRPAALAAYFRIAPELPRHTSMSAVLGYSDLAPGEPVLFVYTVCASRDDRAIGRARAAATAVAVSGGTAPLYRSEALGRYPDGLPEFAVPGASGAGARDSFFGKAVFTGPTLDAALAEALADRMRAAPTRACRIDFQHTGGALGDVADEATAFWGRTAEWSVPLNAIWDDATNTGVGPEWARDTLRTLAPHTTGVYNVELRPGLPETATETRAAYGGNLTRLRALQHRYDPAGTLGPFRL
ncbi:FAD-binding protein [Nocardia sp. ET3-3]|uniref:FAD-binding protein n=1 Tax=Nocardia terrae TaxID=2675851 RepID=A0A7K1UNB2_9NOCA|nr:FAD-binding protein [Nocardia terrae]